jgi:hypothetical protein
MLAIGFAFGPVSLQTRTRSTSTNSLLWSSSQPDEEPQTAIIIEPKEAVKLFGRLAEKFIMLDSSGGMCCYSACSDCEYRLPGG